MESKCRVGDVGNINRFIYKHMNEAPPNPEDIDCEMNRVEAEVATLLGEVTE